jgi:hypothetical protein
VVARIAPFPRPAHRTGRANFPHPAPGEENSCPRRPKAPFPLLQAENARPANGARNKIFDCSIVLEIKHNHRRIRRRCVAYGQVMLVLGFSSGFPASVRVADFSDRGLGPRRKLRPGKPTQYRRMRRGQINPDNSILPRRREEREGIQRAALCDPLRQKGR